MTSWLKLYRAAMKKDKEIIDEKIQMGEQEELIQDNPENQNPDENSNDNQPKTDESAEKIQQLEIEIAEAKDKHLRLFSEFENYRRRTSKERLELISTANEDLIKSLLPVVDDFVRAKKAFEQSENQDPALDGFLLIYHKLIKTLEQKGLKKMELVEGSEFTTDLHEAITQIPAPKEELKGKIVDVVESGYLLGDKVIRFAKVVIGA